LPARTMSRRLQLLRVILLGDANVGTTSLLSRFVNGKWISGYRATLGADFFTKEINIRSDTGQEIMVTLQLWDTAGMERCMSALGPAFFRSSDAVCLCFDLTSRASFEHLGQWRDLFLQYSRSDDPTTVPTMVLANKSDLPGERQVTRSEAERWCREHLNAPYFEVSAKDDTNVRSAFTACASAALAARQAEPILPPVNDIPVVPILLKPPTPPPCAC